MKKWRIDFNAPVILGFAGISFIVLVLSTIFGKQVQYALGAAFSSWTDPFQYTRLFTHVFTHGDLAHFTGNMMLILAVGPIVEEKYGAKPMVIVIELTALVTGLVNVIFFRNQLLIGASGIVFMLILLASFVNIREGKIPLTVILAAALYIGNEIVTGVSVQDNISQISHIIGGLCGGVFGYVYHYKKILQE